MSVVPVGLNTAELTEKTDNRKMTKKVKKAYPVITDKDLPSVLVHSFLATLLFSGVSGLLLARNIDPELQYLPYALGTGLVTIALFFWCCYKTGAQFNPINTLAQWVLSFGKVAPNITISSVIAILIVQVVAGIAGAGIVRGFAGEYSCLGAPVLNSAYYIHSPDADDTSDHPLWIAFFSYVFGNGLLVCAWFAYEHGKKAHAFVAGVSQTLAVLAFFPYGGAAFNPATVLGQFIVLGFSSTCDAKHLWIPLFGSFVGGVLGVILTFIHRSMSGGLSFNMSFFRDRSRSYTSMN